MVTVVITTLHVKFVFSTHGMKHKSCRRGVRFEFWGGFPHLRGKANFLLVFVTLSIVVPLS